MWVSRVTFLAAGDNDLLRVMVNSISSLADCNGHNNYSSPQIAQVRAEWVGWRHGVSDKEPEPSLSEREKYTALMEDVSSPTTILYAFGGSF
jgi:hypothetical protein